jgi:Kelch motif
MLLVPLLVGCGGHTSSTGPTPASRPTTPVPTARRSTVPRLVAARLAAWRLPYPVARAALIGLGPGSVIVAGGLLPGDLSTDHALRLDLAAGRARTLPSLAVPVHDTAGGLVAGTPTVVGGGNASEQSVVQSLGRRHWLREGDLPTSRSDLGVVEWRHHAYVIGGYDGASLPTGILRLSARSAVRRVGSLLHGVRYAAMARLRSDVYVFGGEVGGREIATIQRVDLTTGRTRPAGRLPVPLGHAMAVAVRDRILVMGGRVTPSRQTDATWWYNPATGRVRPAGRLPIPLSDAAVASRKRQIWLLGGETPSVTDRVITVTVR